MIGGIIFDKDGTLFDFRRTWADWAARLMLELAEQDVARAQGLGAVVGFDLATRDFAPDSPVIGQTPVELADMLAPHVPGCVPARLVARMNLLAAEVPLAEAVALRPLLQRLRARGLRIGLVTNDAEVPAHAHLNRAGVADLFDFVAGCDSGHGAKPAPGQLLAFCQQTGLDPRHVVMVGDSLHDLHAGKNAGMRRVGVLTGIARAEELRPHADAVMADIGGLPAWLDAVAAA
jgi:phosphoglycolate phosphatase